MLKPKLPKQEQGFTLVEVLVAILMTTLFVGVAMQSMVIAAIFKARAQEYSEATTWIQEDLENVKYQASQLGTKNVQSMTAADNLITISKHGFANGNPVLFVGAGSIAGGLSKNTNYYVRDVTTNTFKVASTAAGAAINLTSDSTGSLLSIATSGCNVGSTNAGFADTLRDWITDTDHTNGITDITSDDNFVDISKTSNRTRKAFTLKRTTTISSVARPSIVPHNLLRVSYEVLPTSGGLPVAKFYTEVIPDAAFQCP